MRYTDIAIIGGGLAGSTTAAMLGRAGIPAVLIDPHPAYPPDFRVEKLAARADRTLSQDRHRGSCAAGRDVRRRELDRALRLPARQEAEPAIRHPVRRAGQRHPRPDSARRGIDHSPRPCRFRPARSGRKLVLSNGEEISARLVVLANGLNVGLRRQSWNRAPDCQRVPFHFARIRSGSGRSPVLRLSGVDLLLGATKRPHSLHLAVPDRQCRMRANLFVYREIDDPWLQQMRRAPEADA